MRWVICFLLALLPVLAQGATPAAVSQYTASMMQECRAQGGKPSLDSGYQTTVDLNGDGQPDYILDGNHLICRGMMSYFCGSGGCSSAIFTSGPGGYRRTFNDNVYGFTIDHATRPPTLIVSWHGYHCNRSGAEGCEQRLVWNGEKLVVENATARVPGTSRPTASAPSGQWALRSSGVSPIAYVPGHGVLRELDLTCARGRPFAVVVLRNAQSFSGGVLTVIASGRRFEMATHWEARYLSIYAVDLSASDLLGIVTQAQGTLTLSLNDLSLGTVSLAGSVREVRVALSPCIRF